MLYVAIGCVIFTKNSKMQKKKKPSIVFDVQLSIWLLRSSSTDGVKNILLISHFIKFNPYFFKKIYKK